MCLRGLVDTHCVHSLGGLVSPTRRHHPSPPLVASLPFPGGCRPVPVVHSSINLPVLAPVFGRFVGGWPKAVGRGQDVGIAVALPPGAGRARPGGVVVLYRSTVGSPLAGTGRYRPVLASPCAPGPCFGRYWAGAARRGQI